MARRERQEPKPPEYSRAEPWYREQWNSGKRTKERQIWDSPEQAMHVIETARRNPKRDGEGSLAYIIRLAELSGLTPPEEEPMYAKYPPRHVREPGEEG